MNAIKDKWNSFPLALKVSVSYAVCSIIQRCLSFITLPLFTRLLTTEQYGQATIYASWSSLLVIVLTLQLPYGSFSTAMIKYEEKRDEYISSVQGVCLLISALFLFIYFPFKNFLNGLFELPTYIMIIMVVEILANTGIAFWSGKKRFEFKYKEVITLTLISSILSVIVQYVLVMLTEEKGYARIIGGASINILFGGIVFLKNFFKGKKLYNRDFWRYAFGFNVPLLAYYFSQMIFNTSDRIMISHMVGMDKAAVYGVAYNLAILFNFVLTAIYNSYIPWIYGKIKNGHQEDNRVVSIALSVFMAVLLLGIIWLAPEIVYVMADREYLDAIWIIPPVAMTVLLLFYSQLSISFEFYFEEKKSLVTASVSAAVINIVLNWVFIPRLGYYAAGYTTLISYLFFAAANYCAMRRILKKRNITDCGFDVGKLLMILAIFMITGFGGMLLYNRGIVPRLIIVCVMIIAILLNKERFVNVWKSVKIKQKAINAQEHYNLLIEEIKKREEKRLRFGVYVIFDSTYGVDNLFKLMKTSENWDPKIVVIPDISRGDEHKKDTYMTSRDFFVTKYGAESVIDGWNNITNEYYDHLDKFDIVCYANPYDAMVAKVHSIEYASTKNVLPIYVSYGYDIGSKTAIGRLKGPELNLVWKCFTDTVYSYDDYKKYQLIKGKNVVLSGYAKMDSFRRESDKQKEKKRILICAHHTVNSKILPLSNFIKYNELILSLPERFPDLEFVFRPHPLLFTSLKNNHIWSDDRIAEYLCRLREKGIIYSTEGDYMNVFAQCDAIINDCGSFTVEWLFTGKPGCFVYSERLRDKYLTTLMLKAIENYKVARSEDDIVDFISKIDRGDFRCNTEMEEWVKEKIAINYPNVSEFILKEISITDNR